MYTYHAEVVRVVDGDTVKLKVDVGFRLTFTDNFRLVGIDAEELRDTDPAKKALAQAAKTRVEQLLPVGSQVLIRTTKSEKYGRWLVEIDTLPKEAASVHINSLLVAEGLAKPYLV